MTNAFDWEGRVGDVWADEWRRTDRSLAELGSRLDAAIAVAAPGRGSAIDIGCGAGGTSIALARARPGLAITGIDLSPSLVAIASERAAGIVNLAFRVADAQRLGAAGADLLFSRHGVMFFADPVAGFAALRAAARPGAKLVFSCFRQRADNEWALLADSAENADAALSADYTPGPFALADPERTGDILRRAGWNDAAPEAIDFPYVAGAGEDALDDAFGFFSRIGPAARAIVDAPPERREAMREGLRTALARHLHDGKVTFQGAAWIWTATAGHARLPQSSHRR